MRVDRVCCCCSRVVKESVIGRGHFIEHGRSWLLDEYLVNQATGMVCSL